MGLPVVALKQFFVSFDLGKIANSKHIIKRQPQSTHPSALRNYAKRRMLLSF